MASDGNRIEWVETARGIGILLVVVGHVIAGLAAAGLAGGYRESFNFATGFIYSFHMPAFFLLSGLFASHSVRRSWPTFLCDKSGSLLYPYVVWSVIQLAVMLGLSGTTNTQLTWQDFGRLAYDPIMQFWFLYSLFLAFIAYKLIVNCGGGPLHFFAVMLASMWALSGLDVSGTSVIGRARDNWLHFAVGALLSPFLRTVAGASSLLLAVAAGSGTGVVCWMAGQSLVLPAPWHAILIPLPGMCAMFAIAILLTRYQATVGLRTLGRYSLEIYCVHVLAYAGTRIMLIRLFGVTSVPMHFVFGVVAGLLLPLLVIWMSRGIGRVELFRWPGRRKTA